MYLDCPFCLTKVDFVRGSGEETSSFSVHHFLVDGNCVITGDYPPHVISKGARLTLKTWGSCLFGNRTFVEVEGEDSLAVLYENSIVKVLAPGVTIRGDDSTLSIFYSKDFLSDSPPGISYIRERR